MRSWARVNLHTHILVIRNVLKLFYNEICSKTVKVYPFSVEICIGGTVGMSNIKILSVYFLENATVLSTSIEY
jgi:hypothetical protein